MRTDVWNTFVPWKPQLRMYIYIQNISNCIRQLCLGSQIRLFSFRWCSVFLSSQLRSWHLHLDTQLQATYSTGKIPCWEFITQFGLWQTKHILRVSECDISHLPPLQEALLVHEPKLVSVHSSLFAELWTPGRAGWRSILVPTEICAAE